MEVACRNSEINLDQLVVTSDQKVYAGKSFKKCKIFPFGQISLMKEGKDAGQKIAGKVVLSLKSSPNKYQVLAGKVDLEKENGAIPLFFWIAGVEEEEEASMELATVNYQGVIIPYYKAKKTLAKGQLLCFYKEPAGPQSKKAKTS